jgi:phosphoribosylamine---glycine ligase
MLGSNGLACRSTLGQMARVVIEEVLPGEEASFIVVCDGKHRRAAGHQPGPQAHAATATTGPNTGGMGAYSPAPVVTPNVQAPVMREIILPTVQGMAADGSPFTGFLYAGLMIDATASRRRSSSMRAWATPRPSRS